MGARRLGQVTPSWHPGPRGQPASVYHQGHGQRAAEPCGLPGEGDRACGGVCHSPTHSLKPQQPPSPQEACVGLGLHRHQRRLHLPLPLCSEQTHVTQLPSPWLPAPKHSLNLSHCCLVPGELVWCHFPQRAPQTLCGRQRPRSCGSPASSLPRHRGCCPCPELRPHPIRRTQSCQPIVGPSCPRAAMLGLLVLGDSQGAVLCPSLEHTG